MLYMAMEDGKGNEMILHKLEAYFTPGGKNIITEPETLTLNDGCVMESGCVYAKRAVLK